MSLFKNNNESAKPKEINAISDKKLKEGIANAALNMMNKGEDYEELAYTKVHFGYVFQIEDHGIEALFKVITDKTTAYFAVQGQQIMRLNFTEKLFQSTVEGFMEIHG
ncbi:MAG: hypothetical protein IJ779_09435 [Ruminococcus sp.]|nr:hypothetical protein [Ruminococcus sp.]